MIKKILPLLLFVFILASCANAETPNPAALTLESDSVSWTQTVQAVSLSWTRTAAAVPTSTPLPPTETPAPLPSATPTPESLPPERWREWSVIPTAVSDKMKTVYELGQMMGNDPHAFSVVGDCHSETPEFFGIFDTGQYTLAEYDYLQETIDYFAGSFNRKSRTVKQGLTATGALSVLWNDWKDCTSMETPIDCELRLNRPSFVIISLGTNDANGVAPFETMLRRLIDVVIGHGAVPILATKADNAEGDHSINETIARLAYEYEIPLWNFWRAVQPLPDHGVILPDHREHLTYSDEVSSGDFREPYLRYGYNTRNLTGLQALDAVWRLTTGRPILFTPTPIP